MEGREEKHIYAGKSLTIYGKAFWHGILELTASIESSASEYLIKSRSRS